MKKQVQNFINNLDKMGFMDTDKAKESIVKTSQLSDSLDNGELTIEQFYLEVGKLIDTYKPAFIISTLCLLEKQGIVINKEKSLLEAYHKEIGAVSLYK